MNRWSVNRWSVNRWSVNRRSLRRWSVRRRILSVIRNRPGRARPAPCDSARDTHVLVKPDGVSRGLAPEVVRALRQAGLTVETVGHLRLTRAQAERWYPEKLNEPDGFRTLAYLSEGPMLLLAVVGDDALRRTRRVKKDIRRRFGTDERRNVAHCPETRGERDHERGVFGPLVRPCR